ncbi:uncharacterized protein TNIN_383421 [Trichonephila inaurata madagascariensis]|uniref:Uncharacterized protein n=1 Tax=Trichonephila inaurata madagascariensis TaxID=2747483 RepID=A0A8X6XBE4_9ARAC|nr:uncharacterized protein TNIN_489971 [Trichonephila inaurata madagascariensis]GFY56193.1 uncharacterized protein TNIN_383421 [Trichonephila inaurata madagascariensis]
MIRNIHIQTVMTVAIAVLLPSSILAHKPMDISPDITREDYSEFPERNAMDNIQNSPAKRFHIFSEDGNNLFDKSHPRIGNMEENKMAMELQKRISRLVDEPERRRLDLSESKPSKFILTDWELLSNGRRYRRPLLMRSFVDGSFKLSYPPGKKRPYYYSEPEGSEFLGGPGK